MIRQSEIIKEFCDREGFNFVDCDKEGRKVPCSLDKNYKEDNQTIFISGFFYGSKRITYSRGGLKCVLTFKIPVEELTEEEIKKEILPTKFICDKCGKKNLNLKTQDNHKTYDFPDCQEEKRGIKNEKR